MIALAKKGNHGLKATDRHSCCICQKFFSCIESLRKHLVTFHHNTKKISCDLCPKFYFTKPAIVSHMRVHGNFFFSCNICDYRTHSKGHFQRHKLTHSAKAECPICKKQVTVLNEHMKTHTQTKVSCPVCGKLFCKSSSMKHHIKCHRLRKCEKCIKNFENREELRRWVTKALSSSNYQFKCWEQFQT